ncbi:gluconokinase [Xinfangfangia sp. CPCC 101601]|uniref:Gluconokinase n=1 Tax=Pseudogemmobacter lacusdianii TaxID=3069608 RepID=A0ABU0W0B7_9RHOB|nr:gluconokinase [Xinfangfangia sp. CPCC 101601]MDQ2067460.1 gluconokinase [Xinfangfangia sp. CPCC 101601]
MAPWRILVMGVSGCGKSNLAAALAQALGAEFVEGDDLHPAANRAKMAAGTPLDDADRAPWLDRVASALRDRAPVVVACSALRRAYRDRLRQAGTLQILYLRAPEPLVATRLAQRQGHFMPSSLLASQYATLEPPGPDEATALDASLPPSALLRAALIALQG